MKHSMRHFRILGLLLILTLTACQTMYDTVDSVNMDALPEFGGASSESLTSNDCPQAEIVSELGTIIEFANPDAPSLNTMTSRFDMITIKSACKHRGKSMSVDLALNFKGKLGPEASKTGQSFFSYPFFVAVVSPNGTIIAKEIFSAGITYENGETNKTYRESLRHIIPVRSKRHGASHRIMVGFQLSDKQLAFNRHLIKTYGNNN